MSERKSDAERQREYAERMRAAGFRRLSVWVPADDKAKFDEMVVKFQIDWERRGLYPTSKGGAA